MSRVGTADTVIVQPQNNIYTVLAGVAVVVVLLGLIAVYLRADTVMPGGLFGEPPPSATR